MEDKNALSFKPKTNWHDLKKWAKGIHTRRVINHWYIRSNEEIEIDKNGTPILTYPTQEHGVWIYESVPIRYSANIEKHWLKRYRYHNDDPWGYFMTVRYYPAGKSSRRGMKEKAQWWNQVDEYLDENAA